MAKAKLTRYYARGGKKAADMWPHRSGDWVHYGEATAALSEAQGNIARLEALLHEARIFVGYALLYGDRDALDLSERIDAALSPREGEG